MLLLLRLLILLWVLILLTEWLMSMCLSYWSWGKTMSLSHANLFKSHLLIPCQSLITKEPIFLPVTTSYVVVRLNRVPQLNCRLGIMFRDCVLIPYYSMGEMGTCQDWERKKKACENTEKCYLAVGFFQRQCLTLQLWIKWCGSDKTNLLCGNKYVFWPPLSSSI